MGGATCPILIPSAADSVISSLSRNPFLSFRACLLVIPTEAEESPYLFPSRSFRASAGASRNLPQTGSWFS